LDTLFYERLKTLLKEEQILVNEPLKAHTTFKIGGPADYYVIADDVDQVRQIIFCCKLAKMPYFIIGNGSNLLFADEGYRGVIIRLAESAHPVRVIADGDSLEVEADAGILLSKFANQVCKAGYTGFEFATGIPGTLGGAVFMNAGAYGGEIKDCIISADVLDETGKVVTLSKEELKLGYRSSAIQGSNYIVLSAKFSFVRGDLEEILEKSTDFNRQRREKQPLEYPSAGSMFKRPVGYFAGKLIMDAGLRGYRVGDAMISEKHCGFVVNAGNATAKDVLQLIKEVQDIVFEKFGVKIETEVRFIEEQGGCKSE